MKKIYKYVLLLGLLPALSSCDDMFDFGDDGTLSYNVVFKDYVLAGNYLNTCYSYMPLYGESSAAGTFLASYTDEAQDANDVVNSKAVDYYNGKMTSSNNIINSSLYSKMFDGIRACNMFLSKIDNVEHMRVEEYRSKWKGEAYLLRAYYYLQLIKRFGPVPIIKEVLPVDYDVCSIARPTFHENVEAIIADCKLAINEPNLPMRVNSDIQNGSMTKSVAYAIMSQASLFAASPLWNDGNDYWKEALEITKQAKDELEKAGYGLYKPASLGVVGLYSNYQDYFLYKPELVDIPSRDLETIYAQKGQIGNLWKEYGLPMMADVTNSGISPSQELVDSYETIDGEPVLDLEKPYMDADHLVPNYNKNNKMYDPANPYKNRDPRLHSTIFCNGDFQNLKTKNNVVETFVGGNCEISESSKLYTRTGYYLRKFINYESKNGSNKDGYWRFLRMAEIYLNFAEADFYANGRVTKEAADAVNIVRARAGMPGLPYDLSIKDFELRLRNERRVEFAFEEERYYDVRRWKIQPNVEGVVTGMKIEKQSDDNSFKYKRILVQKRNVVDSKYLMWPIPKDEEDKYRNSGVEFQNPGW